MQLKVCDLPECLKTYILTSVTMTKDGLGTSTGIEIRSYEGGLNTDKITEREYYNFFESYLESVNRQQLIKMSVDVRGEKRKNGGGSSDVEQSYTVCLDSKDNAELLRFHLTKVMCGGWIFDHASHMQYAYYPSNVFPIGSTMEFMYFLRPWSRNVNNPYVNRLYKRYPDFDRLLVGLVDCPCSFMFAFNILNKDVYDPKDTANDSLYASRDEITVRPDRRLFKISVDNELMMRSEFFTKKKYVHFNTWLFENVIVSNRSNVNLLYSTLEKSDESIVTGDGGLNNEDAEVEVLFASDKALSVEYAHKAVRVSRVLWFKYKAHQRKVEKQLLNKMSRVGKVQNNGVAIKRRVRLQTMKTILHQIYFRNEDEHANANGSVVCDKLTEPKMSYSDINTFVRCEDHRSKLYSPLLKKTNCKHTDESVYYEQRRIGDEIASEVRKCKDCGSVRIF